jgi:SRSO17 transposase
MNRSQLRKVRSRLDAYLDKILAPIGRSERRHWAALYITGLLGEVERKTVTAIARRLPSGDAQSIQQMLHSSPWDPRQLLDVLTPVAVDALSPVEAMIIDDTGFPKKGTKSVGVARQYSGTLGDVGNCQIAVSLHYANEHFSVPLAWRLYLPREWMNDAERRKKAGIPNEIVYESKWKIALTLLDEARRADAPDRTVVADSFYGSTTEFREALETRGLSYIVGVRENVGCWLQPMHRRATPYAHTGKHPAPRYNPEIPPVRLHEIITHLDEEAWLTVSYGRTPEGKEKSGLFQALRVQPSYRHHKNRKEQPMCWLLIQRRENDYRYYLSNLDESTSLVRLVRLAKMRWRIEMDYQMMKNEIGLDHYEGRSWRGWHHHVALATAAYAFLVLERRLGAFPPAELSGTSKDDPVGNL